MESEIAVIGGGLVGMALAYGLQRGGRQVTVFDEGDRAFRASRGNFGLVWVQGKGAGLPDYARWSRQSAALWPQLAEALRDETGISLELSQPGGFDICLTDREAEQATRRLETLRDALGGDYPFEFLGHNKLRRMLPEIGPDVVGATYCPEDGHVNPLYLLRALYGAFEKRGGRVVNGHRVTVLAPGASGFTLDNGETWRAEKVVLSAGLGNAALAPMVGLAAPVRPNRGQVLVTERVRPFLKYPSVQIRQVAEGAVQIGDSHEDVDFNDAATAPVMSQIARRAVRIYPLLKSVRIVRAWGALRVLSADGFPLYDRSVSCPGAALVTCHSGVTLAAAHAFLLAGWIEGTDIPDFVESFSVKRFELQPAA
jgi:glycine/D-amino acid oxidase-like deaminating enzyme